ncbi:MAG: acetyl ornithine aminotransferase family protein [Candidatus Methanomethylicota archaeon]|nr:MAG: acetyl ornithine aminotransferase family protein [Candidatus Verstraetearchaeota archaeon]
MNSHKVPKIVATPPGPKAKKILEEDERFLMQSFVRWYPLVVEKAEGCILTDVDGNEYIDLNAGIAVVSVGHRHPKVIEAIKEQCNRFLHYSLTDFYYNPAVELAKKLSKITPGKFEKKIFFCNSGAEAVEGALKIARGHFKGSRQYIMAYIGAFHGRLFGSMALTSSKPVQRKWFSPLLPGVEHVPYPYCYRCPWRQNYPECGYWCVDFIEDYYFKKYVPPDETACIIFEPIQGEGGYVVPPPEYWGHIRKLCDKYGILMISDEVQAGMGRTGRWFGIEHWNVTPDLIAIAKGIAAGLPLGAVVGRSEIMDLPRGSHASTFGGNPVSCAAASAVIDVIEGEKLLENASKIGEYTMKRFEEFQEKYELIGDVRGKGLMIGVELVKDRRSKEPAVKELNKILLKCFKKGVAVIGAGKSTIRIAPPLTISMELMEKAIDIIGESIGEVEREG